MVSYPRYTSQFKNDFGLGEHFQGLQRVGRRLLISATQKRPIPRSQLIVVEMGSRDECDAWAIPSYPDHKRPQPNDKITHVIDVDREGNRWHAGGIQVIDGVLAIPIYDTDGAFTSEIRFFEVGRDRRRPRELRHIRLKKPDMDPKAVGMTYLKALDRYVLTIWDDKVLDFHLSKDADLRNGFAELEHRLREARLPDGFFPGGILLWGGTYQCINLVTDERGTVYLLATRNTKKASPTFKGDNLLDIYEVRWPGGDFTARPEVVSIPDGSRVIECKDKQCNFGGAAGVYVADRDHVYLYAAWHWLRDTDRWQPYGGRVSFNEYAYRFGGGTVLS
jgi:hypothetical protein